MNIRADIPTPSTRRSIEDAIERLLALLDRMEGDPDLEANGDEHDASWPEGYSGANFGAACEDDEDGHDAEADKADAEPELGWTEDINQTTSLLVRDGEAEGGEPFLGWPETCGQGQDECDAGRTPAPGIDPAGDAIDGPSLDFRGDGHPIAKKELRKAKPRKEPKMIGEKRRLLADGSFFKTLVGDDTDYVFRAVRRLERTTLEEMEAMARRQPPGII
jgi:hypothetical protein